MSKVFGKKIREIRQRPKGAHGKYPGLTLKELSSDLEFSLTALSNVESGSYSQSTDFVNRFVRSKLLCLTSSEVSDIIELHIEDIVRNALKNAGKEISKIEKLSKKKKKLLIDTIDSWTIFPNRH